MKCNKCKKEYLETELLNGICQECATTNNVEDIYPMNWFNFWKYFRFPLAIINFILTYCNIIFLQEIEIMLSTLIFVIIDALIFMYTCITYAFFCTHKKVGYKLLIICLGIETGYIPFQTLFIDYLLGKTTDLSTLITSYFATLAIWVLIWFLPNYIYFNKRKDYFYEENTKEKNFTDTNNKQEDKKTSKIKDNNQKSNKNKKAKTDIIDKLLIVTMAVETMILTFVGIYLHDTIKKSNKKDDQILELQEKISIQETNSNMYKLQRDEYKEKADFMDNYIVIVPVNTSIYHKYDCKYLDTSNFYAFNIATAKSQGYVACKHCIK